MPGTTLRDADSQVALLATPTEYTADVAAAGWKDVNAPGHCVAIVALAGATGGTGKMSITFIESNSSGVSDSSVVGSTGPLTNADDNKTFYVDLFVTQPELGFAVEIEGTSPDITVSSISIQPPHTDRRAGGTGTAPGATPGYEIADPNHEASTD